MVYNCNLIIAAILPVIVIASLDIINYTKFIEYNNIVYILVMSAGIYGLYIIPMNHLSIINGLTKDIYKVSILSF